MKNRFTNLRRGLALATLLAAASLSARAQNVGIGTTTPTKTLDVNGDVRVRGLNGTGTRLPVVLPDGTLGVNAPVFSASPAAGVPTGAASSVGTGSNPYNVAVSGTTAYVVNYNSNTLQLFNVATPGAPALLGTVATGNSPRSVAVSGTTAYVVNFNSNTLQVFSGYTRVVAVNPDGSFASVVLPPSVEPPLAANGILKASNTFSLGGVLDRATTLAAGNQSFSITQDVKPLGASAVDLNTIGTGKPSPIYGRNTQSFSPGVTGIMTQVELSLTVTSGNSYFPITIQVLDASGAVLMTTNSSFGTVGSAAPLIFTFAVSVQLTAGQVYTLVVDPMSTTSFAWNNRNGFYYRTTMRAYGAAVANQPLFTMAGGFVGINTATPNYPLDVNGAMRCISLTQTSDARLKQNVRPVGHALAGVLALRGVRYTFRRTEFPTKKLPGGEQLGFLAQELENVYPELVSTDTEGYKAVNYAQLVPVLVEALKEQQQQIEALKTQNAALQTGAAQAGADRRAMQVDHASLLTLQAQMARLLGEAAPAAAQARR